MLKQCPREDCPNSFEPTIKHGYETKFCSRSCANSRQFTQESKDLKSRKTRAWLDSLTDKERKILNQKLHDNGIRANKARTEQQRIKLLETPTEELSHGSIRKRILLEQENKCNRCELDTWLEEPLVLELEHKDGNSKNNKRDNLEGLCPNCHSLTPTWRGRNKNTGKKTVSDVVLLEALKTEKNIHQALQKVGMASKGTNYNRAKKLLKILDSERKA